MTLSRPTRPPLSARASTSRGSSSRSWDGTVITAQLDGRCRGPVYTLSAIAEKRGVQIFHLLARCRRQHSRLRDPPQDRTAVANGRRAPDRLRRHGQDDADLAMGAREPGNLPPVASITTTRSSNGDALIQKLSHPFPLDEEEGLTLTGVRLPPARCLRPRPITKRFYDRFKQRTRRLPGLHQWYHRPGRPGVVCLADAQPPDVRLLHPA